MTEAPQRQVDAQSVINKLREKNEELSYQNVIAEAIIDQLQEELGKALQLIDQLAPNEEIEDGE